ncbi:MAG: hypothetical protein ACHQU1_08890 [Gemmatimonadales bacterium]
MQYFYRAHTKPERVLAIAQTYFVGHGFAGDSEGDDASYSDIRGHVTIKTESEGGHYTRVTIATDDVGESELDKVAKRFLSELHAAEEPAHVVRGAY